MFVFFYLRNQDNFMNFQRKKVITNVSFQVILQIQGYLFHSVQRRTETFSAAIQVRGSFIFPKDKTISANTCLSVP